MLSRSRLTRRRAIHGGSDGNPAANDVPSEPREADTTAARARGAGLVLIADDTFDTRELYDLYLTRCGFSVLTVADGEAAVQTALESRPDVIILDFSMPRVDGIAATKRLKEHALTRHIPVIMVTGFPHQATQCSALESGAAAFLTKPCLPEDLGATVRRLLDRGVTDVASVAELLRLERDMCMDCVAAKLTIDLECVIAAVEALGKTITVDQTLSRCTVCGQTRWVLSLAK